MSEISTTHLFSLHFYRRQLMTTTFSKQNILIKMPRGRGHFMPHDIMP